MLKILKYFNLKNWLLIFLSFALIIGQVWLDLTLPEYMSEITTILMSANPNVKDIIINGLFMLGCALGSAGLSIIVGYIIAKTASQLSYKLRKTLFGKVQSFSMGEMNKFTLPSLITRTTNDIARIQNFVSMGLQLMIKAPILAVWAVLKILNKSLQWSFVTLIAVVVILVFVVVLMIFVLPQFKKIQKLNDDLNRVTRENLTNVRVVRAFNAEDYTIEEFDKVNNELKKTQIFTGRLMSLMSPVMAFIMSGLTLAIYFIGAYLIQDAMFINIQVDILADMLVFSSYAMQVVMAFMMLIMIFIMFPRASVSAGRVNEVLQTKNSIIDGSVTQDLGDGTIEFKNVSFKYPDAEEYVLENISFKVSSGKSIAFIGSTGSGKSTLINLIPRFYDVTEGEILIDGVNVKEYNLETLHNKIGYISQRAVLFSGNIQENIKYGKSNKEITDEDIQNALDISNSSEFVNALEDGVNAVVNQGGTNFSGGQKQRLSIARALAKNPEILIFDDSFSALDYKTDKNVRSAIKNHTNATLLIIGQRIGTIKDCDQIVVLDDGKMAGIGTHEHLLETCQVYKEIALSQLSKEEL